MPQRESLAHRFLYYLYNNTSEKYQVWRNVTIDFFYNLHEIMSKNHGIVVYPYENDGIKIYYDQKDVAYLHIRQRWILFHANKEYLIYKSGDKIFPKCRVEGSFPRMWKVSNKDYINNFLNFLDHLEIIDIRTMEDHSRNIPISVRQQVWDRDKGKCCICRSEKDICFDHIIPYSLGGTSCDAQNIQLLCRTCNLKKGAKLV